MLQVCGCCAQTLAQFDIDFDAQNSIIRQMIVGSFSTFISILLVVFDEYFAVGENSNQTRTLKEICSERH